MKHAKVRTIALDYLGTQTYESSNYFDTYLLTKTFLNDLSQFSLFATNNNNDD